MLSAINLGTICNSTQQQLLNEFFEKIMTIISQKKSFLKTQACLLGVIVLLVAPKVIAQTAALKAFEEMQKAEANAANAAAQEDERRETTERIRSTGQGAEAKFFKATAPGVVKDSRTGLEWMRCSLGQEWDEKSRNCIGFIDKYPWRQAAESAKKINTAGGYAKRTDWRLPTATELQSLRFCSGGFASTQVTLPDGNGVFSKSCAEGSATPTVARAIFPNMQGAAWYWTSSPFKDSGHFSVVAWVVKFTENGELGPNGLVGNQAVRLVRGN